LDKRHLAGLQTLIVVCPKTEERAQLAVYKRLEIVESDVVAFGMKLEKIV
jgi:hypothetical protein